MNYNRKGLRIPQVDLSVDGHEVTLKNRKTESERSIKFYKITVLTETDTDKSQKSSKMDSKYKFSNICRFVDESIFG